MRTKLWIASLCGAVACSTADGEVDAAVELDAALEADAGVEFDAGEIEAPTDRALFRWTEIAAGLRGSFDIPPSQDDEDHRFAYSHGIHAQLANGNLLVQGHNSDDLVAEVQLPSTLDGSNATRVGEFFDVTGALHPSGWDDGQSFVLGGMLEVGDRVYFTKHQWYNASGDDWDSLGYWDGAQARGLWNIAGSEAHSQRFGGYMSYAPAVLRAAGYELLAGQQGASGAATGRWGPNLFAVDFDDDVAVAGEQAVLPLIYHSDDEHTASGWWVGDRVTDAEWIETDTHHAVLFFLYRGLGAQWYGLEDEGPTPNPYGGGAMGYHAEGWSLEVWIYDPEDLLAVSRGEMDPPSISPAERAILVQRLPGSSEETYLDFIPDSALACARLAASYRDGRLVVLDPEGNRGQFEDSPRGYVFELE
jgi:hypothetical protein